MERRRAIPGWAEPDAVERERGEPGKPCNKRRQLLSREDHLRIAYNVVGVTGPAHFEGPYVAAEMHGRVQEPVQRRERSGVGDPDGAEEVKLAGRPPFAGHQGACPECVLVGVEVVDNLVLQLWGKTWA